jgi:hypothetical protein
VCARCEIREKMEIRDRVVGREDGCRGRRGRELEMDMEGCSGIFQCKSSVYVEPWVTKRLALLA